MKFSLLDIWVILNEIIIVDLLVIHSKILIVYSIDVLYIGEILIVDLWMLFSIKHK